METEGARPRGVVFWSLVIAMTFTILGSSLRLMGGVEGDIRRIALWVSIGGAGLLLLILGFAPQLLVRAHRDGDRR